MNKTERQPGQSVFKLVEDKRGDLYVMEGVVTACRVIPHPDPESRYYPQYVEIDIQWFAGAPADIVAEWGYETERDPDDYATSSEELVAQYVERVSTQLHGRLEARAAAKAQGRILVFPAQEKEEW